MTRIHTEPAAHRPNLFIVGAPKCGTTAMYHYLKQHPEIFFAIAKEPHFFGKDLSYSTIQLTEDKYLSYFMGATQKWRGEASVFYLYSEDAAREIRAFSPDARIIIMLRAPVDMLYSLHSQYLFNEQEDIQNFEEAFAATDDRKAGRRIPPHCRFLKGLFYPDVARFTPQVKRYLEAFGREQVRIILYDDFKQRTVEVYREVLQFLGVSPNFSVEFSVVNPNKELRSKALRRFYGNPPSILRSAARLLLPLKTRYAVLELVRSLNAKYTPRPPLDAAVRSGLLTGFHDDIDQLSRLLDRDLTFWKRASVTRR